ncbi:Gfo/Idh/MocA family protein [Streptomyces sp. ST2-7A]|uniref:Gfo/Idh/MocA family protein n=1 Tax=Streptomyces sp. ST2-7A TaxID=2907214 RepID=UPI001F37783A|nr:Gfo/Idh/MocA family oxidoreductase [Streptomyces sp. ST2-7A]MCE7082462.1 Gfo/Idh/MocA family oxidoreductase [Streptomyces sp. ST2-7A]
MGETEAMRPVRVGVLGCASFARRRMLPAFAAADGVQLTAIASRDAGKAESLARRYGCRAVHGYQRLLEDDEVEAVYLPLPAALHAEWAEAALRAGRHVLVEKPMTTHRKRTADLMALAGERGVVLMENMMFVHHSQHAAIRELLADGAIGELRVFRAQFTVPRRPDSDIRYRPELAGGALWDVGVYPVRAAVEFLGPEQSVVGAVLTHGCGFDVDTSGAALLTTPAGAAVDLVFGLDHGYANRYEFCGTDGRIVADRVFTLPADRPPSVTLERDSGAEQLALPCDDQVRNAVDAFVRAVRRGAAPGEQSLRTAGLIDDIRRYARLVGDGRGADARAAAGAGVRRA